MSGYNEVAYRDARLSVIDIPCPFERALLSRCVNCGRARKVLLAEREAIACTDQGASARCKRYHEAVHQNARFALHMDPSQPWPFGKEIRAQCGAGIGLREALHEVQAESGQVLDDSAAPDIAALLDAGEAAYGDLEAFPYSTIMRAVVHYEPRRRRG